MTAQTVMPHVPVQSDEEWLATPCILAQGSGVSLTKITDRPNGAVMITSVGEEDYRVFLSLDVAHRLPRGQRRGMDRNDLRALSRVFHTLSR